MSIVPIRVGLIGFGKIAREQHLPALLADPHFVPVALADPALTQAGLPCYPDFSTLVAAGHELDAVSICTPPAMRAAIAQQAMAAGCHVLLEKPPAATPSQLTALIDSAKHARRSLYAAWHARESAGVDAARSWLQGRGIDKVEVVWREDIRKWHPGQEWLLGREGLGVFDPAINALSILTEILPCDLRVESAKLVVPANREAPIAATVAMKCAQGSPVSLDLDFLHAGPERWEILIETDGRCLELREGGMRLLIDDVPEAVAEDHKYQRIYARFAALLATNQIEADTRPLALVADIMTLASISRGSPFQF